MRFFIPAFARDDSHALLFKLGLPGGRGRRGPSRLIELKYKDRVGKKNVVDEAPHPGRVRRPATRTSGGERRSLGRPHDPGLRRRRGAHRGRPSDRARRSRPRRRAALRARGSCMPRPRRSERAALPEGRGPPRAPPRPRGGRGRPGRSARAGDAARDGVADAPSLRAGLGARWREGPSGRGRGRT